MLSGAFDVAIVDLRARGAASGTGGRELRYNGTSSSPTFCTFAWYPQGVPSRCTLKVGYIRLVPSRGTLKGVPSRCTLKVYPQGGVHSPGTLKVYPQGVPSRCTLKVYPQGGVHSPGTLKVYPQGVPSRCTLKVYPQGGTLKVEVPSRWGANRQAKASMKETRLAALRFLRHRPNTRPVRTSKAPKRQRVP